MSKVDWPKALALEMKVAAIIAEQVRTGWQFDTEKAKGLVVQLDSQMAQLDSEIRPLLKQYPSQKGATVKAPFKADGSYTLHVEGWRQGEDIGGPFTRIEWNELSLTQRDKLMDQLIKMGWQPSSYTEKGAPQLTPNKEPCPNLTKIPGDLGPKLSQYFLAAHRRGQIQGWVENVRPDGRIEAQVRPNATNTGRGAHRVVANVPKAEESVFLGKEMRSLFIAAPGRILVGCDAKGLELRKLAHYMNDAEFTHEILQGDIHTVLWESTNGVVPSRSVNKNVLYCMIFGGSDRKMGETAGYTGRDQARVGAQIRAMWMGRFPALKSLIERVEKAANRGYLIGLDGRKIWMRKDGNGRVMKHKALNTLLQCGGSIVMKTAMCFQDKWIKQRKLDSKQVGWYHDETTHECILGLEEEVGEIMKMAIVKAGEFYNLNCPMDGDPKSGLSWGEIH